MCSLQCVLVLGACYSTRSFHCTRIRSGLEKLPGTAQDLVAICCMPCVEHLTHVRMQVLREAHDFTQLQLSGAVERFRVAMQALAEFFSCLNASVQRIERTAATIECVVKQNEYKRRYV